MNNILSLSQIGNYFSLNCACALILYGILDVVQETESTLLEDRVSSYRFLSLTRSDESNKKHIHTYINTYINTYIHTHIFTYIHTYIHTSNQTVDHLLFECSKLNNEREKLMAYISREDNWPVKKSELVNKY